jgi:hypothetical protein
VVGSEVGTLLKGLDRLVKDSGKKKKGQYAPLFAVAGALLSMGGVYITPDFIA